MVAFTLLQNRVHVFANFMFKSLSDRPFTDTKAYIYIFKKKPQNEITRKREVCLIFVVVVVDDALFMPFLRYEYKLVVHEETGNTGSLFHSVQ